MFDALQESCGLDCIVQRVALFTKLLFPNLPHKPVRRTEF
jgi:hypothetical protein